MPMTTGSPADPLSNRAQCAIVPNDTMVALGATASTQAIENEMAVDPVLTNVL
jgi:hypothetical protein